METESLRWVVARWSTALCLLIVAIELGAGLYEHRVVDAVWSERLSMIQPSEGGMNRKAFWMPLHGLLTLGLPIATWACWRDSGLRWQLLVALGLYIAMRAWTFAYFIPGAIRFEEAIGRTDLAEDARRWIFWSFLRTPMVLGALVPLASVTRRLWAT